MEALRLGSFRQQSSSMEQKVYDDYRLWLCAKCVPILSDAVSKAEAALKKEGFGVLCQIDIQFKLKEKLGVDFPAT
jgi:hypothetical protein